MNLFSTVSLYAGGPGSGCNPAAGNCGRKPGLSLKEDAYMKGRTHFLIKGSKGETVGNVTAHMVKEGETHHGKNFPKNTLIVDDLVFDRALSDRNEKVTVHEIRSIAKELKKAFPEAKFVAGMRLRGARYNQDKKVRLQPGNKQKSSMSRLWTVVPLHASVDFLTWKVGK